MTCISCRKISIIYIILVLETIGAVKVGKIPTVFFPFWVARAKHVFPDYA